MTTTSTKFWVLQELENFILQQGVSQPLSDLITFACACLILWAIIWIVDILGVKMALIYIKKAAKRTKTIWDDCLYKRRFFHRVVRLIPAIIVLFFINVIFSGYDTKFIESAQVIMRCVIIGIAIGIISAGLDAANDVYDTRSKEKSIKGFVQTAKIMAYIIGVIWMISIIFNEDPSKLFVGLGASAAIVTLVFKDTILGFVSSIQLSAQDMIRRGDWISVPSQNADGIVQEVTLSTVKVQNWDNTVTMLPIYSLVSQSFTNWRSMQESSGRRFLRQLYIESTSVVVVQPQEVTEICTNELTAPLAQDMMLYLEAGNTSPFITNIGLFRCYIEAFVRSHPNINTDLQIAIRYLPQVGNGIAIEIYAYVLFKDLIGYERTISDIFEHIMAVSPIFKVRLFQVPTGADIRSLDK